MILGNHISFQDHNSQKAYKGYIKINTKSISIFDFFFVYYVNSFLFSYYHKQKFLNYSQDKCLIRFQIFQESQNLTSINSSLDSNIISHLSHQDFKILNLIHKHIFRVLAQSFSEPRALLKTSTHLDLDTPHFWVLTFHSLYGNLHTLK